MATKDYGSISKTTPTYNPFKDDGMFNLDLERKRRALNDARSKLQHLKDMNKMIGTSADNKEHRVAIQKNIKGLLSDTVELVRDCVNVSLDKEMAQGSSQERLMNKFIRESSEFTEDFQRTSEMIERSQSINPLSSQHTFGSNDSDEQTPGVVTVTKLQMEAERREQKVRSRAFHALMQDVNGLESLMEQMAVEVGSEQEGIEAIERNVDEEAASNVSDGHRSLLKAVVVRGIGRNVDEEAASNISDGHRSFLNAVVVRGIDRNVGEEAASNISDDHRSFLKAVVVRRKRRKFIAIIICIVVGVVIMVVLSV